MGLTPTRTSARIPGAVLALIGALLLIGMGLDVLVLGARLDVADVDRGQFALAAAAFGIAEAVVLHIETGRNAHSVSLAELPLAVALFFLPPGPLLAARVVGGGAVLLLVRRQRAVKVLFNVSVWVVDVAVAEALFQQLGGGLTHGAERLIVPTMAAALSAAAVDSLAVNLVIALTSTEMHLRGALRSLAACLVGGVACATMGLVCVGALAWSAWLLLPILLVVALILMGFHRFALLRREHSNVKVLYDFTDELAHAAHGQQLVDTMLHRVRELLRAEQSLLVVCEDGSTMRVTRLMGDQPRTVMLWTLAEAPRVLLVALEHSGTLLLQSGDQRRAHREFLQQLELRDALLAPVTSQQGVRGVLVVADRMGEVSTFSASDALLLQTLAAHAGTALANAHLVRQLDHDSSHDSLTGLANRVHFQRRLTRALQSGQSVAVLLMDLDRFKEVNDTLGHHHGDLLLRQIAARLGGELRKEDLFARLGGDEFAFLLSGMSEVEVVSTAERLRSSLGAPMLLQGVVMEVTGSIGIAFNGHAPASTDAALMLQRADVAMYNAKKLGSGLQVYSPALDDYNPRRLALAGSLRAAIDAGHLSLRYQPQARLGDGVVVGVEALVRWEHPAYGEIPPEDFITIAEQTGQIRELTRCVLDMALRDLARWRAAGHVLAVSVNVSVRNLLEEDLVDTVAQLLAEHSVPSRSLTLEITETHLMADRIVVGQVLGALGRLGVRLSVDDFGTGYSSLAYLKQLPVSEVKIDKSFIQDLATDGDDAAIVEAIVQVAHTLRLEVVAEGVEDELSRQTIADLGCDLQQGFHLARPMRAADLEHWLGRLDAGCRVISLPAIPPPAVPLDAVPSSLGR